MSLLIVRCPLKPFANANSSLPNAWQDLGCAENFEWCLVDDIENPDSLPVQFGIGTTESMPYADESLVLLPTFDVRLLEAKVPLANAKKLQQIFPNLIEDYVLAGAEALTVQALPPAPDSQALQRVLALIDRAWFAWLSKQLECLLSPRVRLIPDCLLLPMPSDSEPAIVIYQKLENNIIYTQRSGLQLGASWVEQSLTETNNLANTLPQALSATTVIEISWEWLAKSARDYLILNSSSRAVNFTLNLLPKTFKRNPKSSGFGSLAILRSAFSDRASTQREYSSRLSWLDPSLWRQPFNWMRYCVLTGLIGFGLHLGYLTFDNWRWTNQMQLLAAQSLSPAAVATLNQTQSDGSSRAAQVLSVFTKQVTQDQRRQGVVVDADFAPMAAKLQQLKSVYGAEVLQKIEYDGYAINFEFKRGSIAVDQQAVVNRARGLGIAVKYVSPDRYRLEPYAGLGDGS